MSMLYFSCSGGSGRDSTNSVLGHVMPKFCFSIQCELWVTYYILVHPGREISTHYFSCIGNPGAVSTKRAPRHVTLNLCFCIWHDMRVT
jgi:hypothetical protein